MAGATDATAASTIAAFSGASGLDSWRAGTVGKASTIGFAADPAAFAASEVPGDEMAGARSVSCGSAALGSVGTESGLASAGAATGREIGSIGAVAGSPGTGVAAEGVGAESARERSSPSEAGAAPAGS